MKARVLIIECTFLDERKSIEAARAGCHIHLDEIIERARPGSGWRAPAGTCRRFRKGVASVTMLAVLKRDEHSAISLERIRVPEPGPDDVLARVKATAICGTDLHIAHWSGMAQSIGVRLPLVLGHEFSGEIVETGRNVRGLARGDYIAGETHIPCGQCYQCLNGVQHICGRLKMFGIHRDGSFAEYTTIPALCARKIPASVPPKIGAILEPLGTSLRAVLELSVSGEVVLVTGCGPIGLLAIAAAKAMGSFRVKGVYRFVNPAPSR